MHETQVTLSATSNQALGLGRFAVDFMSEAPGKRGDGTIENTPSRW